jgi:hypothetical protein
VQNILEFPKMRFVSVDSPQDEEPQPPQMPGWQAEANPPTVSATEDAELAAEDPLTGLYRMQAGMPVTNDV